ncbi:MAG: hypothetical protein IJU76_15150 [Desulfovibrionaceae bacterium]|nr:hypothetical protein [Desulfovibrionaceae bacterium]
MDKEVAEKLMQAAAEYLFVTRREALGMSFDAIAKKVFPDEDVSKSRMKVHRFIKKQSTNNKPKKMYLDDFVIYCEALEVDPIRALAEILSKVEKEK